MKEFEIYVPLAYKDGSPVEPVKIERIGEDLLEQFGGLTYFPQPNKGFWRMGDVTFRDEIVIFRVLASNARSARKFLRQLKERLKKELVQEQILIVERDVGTL